MKAEVGNLRIAWRYWLAQSDLGRMGSLAGSLLSLNEARGWYQDTVMLATDMLAVLARTSATPASVGKEIALRLTLARALMATRGFTPEVVDAYTQALDLFERGETSEGQHYSVLRGLSNLYILRSEFDKAAVIGTQILTLAEAQSDPRMEIDGHLIVGSTMAFTGQLRDGQAHLDTAIDMFKEDLGRPQGSRVGNDPRVACLTTSAFIMWTRGFPDQAVERADAAIALSDQLGHAYTSAYARFHSGFLHLWRREFDLVLDRAIRLQEIADEYDFRVWSAIGSCLLGAAQTGLGQVDEGLARSREGIAAYQGIVAPPVFVPMLRFMDAGSRARAGRPAEALPLVASAIELVGGVDSPAMILPEILVLRGDALRDTGDRDGAVGAWTQALAAARRIEARSPELRALTRLAVAVDEADRATFVAELRDAHSRVHRGLRDRGPSGRDRGPWVDLSGARRSAARQCRVATGDAAFVLNARSTTSWRAPTESMTTIASPSVAVWGPCRSRTSKRPPPRWRMRISAVLPRSATTSVMRLVAGSRMKPRPSLEPYPRLAVWTTSTTAST